LLKIVSPGAKMDRTRPLAVLDRDGLINKDRADYVKSWEEFEFIPGVLDALALLKRAEINVAVASNQAGVAKGLYTVEDLVAIHGGMDAAVADAGGEIAAAFYCIHGPDDGCNCRKPEPGLIEAATEEFGAESGLSFMVGDAERDITAGKSAGLSTVLVRSGHAGGYSEERIAEISPDFVVSSLLDAAGVIIETVKKRAREAEKSGTK
jgi:D-glycero-D-manno-heptose 1,7-bisphosphate phosphatase